MQSDWGSMYRVLLVRFLLASMVVAGVRTSAAPTSSNGASQLLAALARSRCVEEFGGISSASSENGVFCCDAASCTDTQCGALLGAEPCGAGGWLLHKCFLCNPVFAYRRTACQSHGVLPLFY